MLFNFELFPINDVAPWTTPSQGNAKSLGWFGLTHGWYWIDTGAGELLRYSLEIRAYWAQMYPEVKDYPYVDYQVSRLWEDLLYMLPTVLEPVPEDLADYLRPGGKWNNGSDWENWSDRTFEWANSHEDEAGWDTMLGWDISGKATHWWSSRELDFGYLTKPPHMWLWREADQIHIQWDNRGQTIESIPVWASASSQVTLPVADFVAEVRSFDKRLIEAMAERIASIQNHWSRPEIHIDIPGMMKDHAYRTTLLDAALTSAREPTDWDQVRTSLAAMERHLADVAITDGASETDAD